MATDPEPLFEGLDQDTVEEVLAAEPVEREPAERGRTGPRRWRRSETSATCGAPFFAGHARATAELVRGAAELMQMPAADARLAYRAALIHDVGRFGVPGSVWGKPGPLTANEQERVRLHVYYVERIFNRPEPLRRIGLLAATHHERMDGSGYHRGVGGTMLSSQARVLAVADAYSAMRQPRPYRGPRSEAEVVRVLRAEATEGRLDPIATDAVLAAAGHRVNRTRTGGPAGLTARENEVLASSPRECPTRASPASWASARRR